MNDLTPEQELERLRNHNKELLNDLASLKQIKSSIDELGGIEQIKNIFESSEELKNRVAEASTNVETVRTQLSKKLEEKDKALQAFKNRVLDSRVNETLKSAVTKAGGIWDLLDTKVKSRVKYEYNDETDELKVNVLDAEGKPALKEGNPYTLDDLVGEFKQNETFGRAFEVNKERSGTGVPPTQGAKKTSFNNPFLSKDIDEQTRLFQKDPNLARRLQAEARAQIRA